MMQVNSVPRWCALIRSLSPDSDVHKFLIATDAGHLCVSCAILIHKSVEMGHVSFACGKREMSLEQDTFSCKSLESEQRLTPRTKTLEHLFATNFTCESSQIQKRSSGLCGSWYCECADTCSLDDRARWPWRPASISQGCRVRGDCDKEILV